MYMTLESGRTGSLRLVNIPDRALAGCVADRLHAVLHDWANTILKTWATEHKWLPEDLCYITVEVIKDGLKQKILTHMHYINSYWYSLSIIVYQVKSILGVYQQLLLFIVHNCVPSYEVSVGYFNSLWITLTVTCHRKLHQSHSALWQLSS